MKDARKPLQRLHAEWNTCARCQLADRRINEQFPLVFGEGNTRGIMFIGEGPGKDEEVTGRPFVGKSGKVLRYAINKLNLQDVYITNAVACRSCGQAFSSEGQPIFRTDRRTGAQLPLIKDEPPPLPCVQACRPRLQEQIYIVDPVLIVALGANAVQALTGRPAAITALRGSTQEIEVEGAWQVPVLTEKKRVWARKVKGQMTMPTRPNRVRYLMLPTLHPAYVLRNYADRREGNPTQQFAEDMKRAAEIFDRYMFETHGVRPGERYLSADDIRDVGDE